MAGDTLQFHFRVQKKPGALARVGNWLKFWSKENNKFPELKFEYAVTFESADATYPATTRLASNESIAQLEIALDKMLDASISEQLAGSVADQLHSLLFADRKLDAVFDRARQGSPDDPREKEIRIFADDDDSIPLLANLPWELARDILSPDEIQHRPLLGTLASHPVVRAVPASGSRKITQERLRVLACIANYEGDVRPFDAAAFERAISESLTPQPLRLEFVRADKYQPTASQTYAEISSLRPHIFIFVGHGQSYSGTPRLRFEEWFKLEELAQRLGQTEQTVLAIFIACDQSRIIQSPAAQSGALTLLRNGIRSVVAMQGYIDPAFAEIFLKTFIESLFITHSISISAGEGRTAMERTLRNQPWTSDWVLPAVFRGGGEESEKDELSLILGHYQPAQERLLSFIPPAVTHLKRPSLEGLLEASFQSANGLLHISGGIGNGRTHLVRVVSFNSITAAIHNRSVLARPIFYIDLDEAPDSETEFWLVERLRNRFDQVRPLLSASTLSTFISTNQASVELVSALLSELDRSRVIVIIDHIRDDATGFWAELSQQAVRLQKSLLVVIGDSELVPEGAPVLPVPPFTLEETRSYFNQFIADKSSLADTWFNDSGGTPLLLDGLRTLQSSTVFKVSSDIVRKEESIGAKYMQLIAQELEPEELATLGMFAWFSGLVEVELASKFIPASNPLETLTSLTRKGVLSKVSRSGLDWLALPRLKAEALDSALVNEAALHLIDSYEQVAFGSDNPNGFDELILKPGGLTILRAVESALLHTGDYEKATTLVLLLQLPLERKPAELYKFVAAVFEANKDLDASSVWLRAAGCARQIGKLDEAVLFLSKVKVETLDEYSKAQALNTRATIMKDRGQVDKTEEILQLLEEAITKARAGSAGSIPGRASAEEWEWLLSELLYNRAAILEFLARRHDDAMSDLREVQRVEETRRPLMAAAAMCQEVDFEVSKPESVENWARLLSLAGRAYRILKDEPTHDFAYCCYQFARYYRLRPGNSEDERKQNLAIAARFYDESAKAATVAGDFRRRAAAVEHWTKVSWENLGTLSAEAAAGELDVLLPTLRGYSGDAYVTRILRDTLFLRFQIENRINAERAVVYLREACSVAAANILSKRGEDRLRGAGIFLAYLKDLKTAGNKRDADTFLVDHEERLKEWLETSDIAVDQPWEVLTKLTTLTEKESYGQRN